MTRERCCNEQQRAPFNFEISWKTFLWLWKNIFNKFSSFKIINCVIKNVWKKCCNKNYRRTIGGVEVRCYNDHVLSLDICLFLYNMCRHRIENSFPEPYWNCQTIIIITIFVMKYVYYVELVMHAPLLHAPLSHFEHLQWA